MNLLEQFKAFLKAQGLEDTIIENIVKGMPGAKIYLSAEEKIDERYNKLKGQKELLDEQLETANGTIETLRKDNGSNEALQGEVIKYKNDLAALQDKYDKDVVKVEKKQQIIDALKKEGATHADLLAATIDLNAIELKDGKISGHKDVIKKLKEDNKDLFKEIDPEDGKAGKDDNGGGGDPYVYTPAGGKDGAQTPVDIFSAMAEFSVHK